MRSARIKLHKFPLPWKPCAFQIFVEWNLSAQFVLIGANLCGLTRRGIQDVGSKKKKKKVAKQGVEHDPICVLKSIKLCIYAPISNVSISEWRERA